MALGVQNEAGQRLTEFCQENALVIKTPSSNNTRENSTHGHCQMVNNEIRLIIFFAAKDREVLYNQQKQDWELTVAQIMNSLVQISDLKKVGKTTRPFRHDLNQVPYDYTVEVTNRFKELDLIYREPEELWTEGQDIVQEAVIKTIPPPKKCKKAKWLPEEALQIAEKRREVKGKGEKERYTHLNAEFQRRARRDKKAFLNDQSKEIEENKRVGKARDHFKKIRDTKGIFHAKMGTKMDRNGMDLTEAEDIKKRWQEYTVEMYKKDHDPDNHDGVITHLVQTSWSPKSSGP